MEPLLGHPSSALRVDVETMGVAGRFSIDQRIASVSGGELRQPVAPSNPGSWPSTGGRTVTASGERWNRFNAAI
jgi:hypothetical protein